MINNRVINNRVIKNRVINNRVINNRVICNRAINNRVINNRVINNRAKFKLVEEWDREKVNQKKILKQCTAKEMSFQNLEVAVSSE